MKAAITLAARSEIGILNQMPSTPQKSGRMSKSGMSITTWRLSERMMAFFAMPMLWKKFDVTIWKPMIGKNIITIRRPRAERSIKVWSVVKAFATSSGISSPTKNPVVVTIVAAMTVIFITWFTRWYWRAP